MANLTFAAIYPVARNPISSLVSSYVTAKKLVAQRASTDAYGRPSSSTQDHAMALPVLLCPESLARCSAKNLAYKWKPIPSADLVESNPGWSRQCSPWNMASKEMNDHKSLAGDAADRIGQLAEAEI